MTSFRLPFLVAGLFSTSVLAGDLKHPDWHPDGSLLLAEGSCRGSIDLFIVDLEMEAVRHLYDGGQVEGYPRWFGNGEQVAFHQIDQERRARIFVADFVAGSRLANVRPVTPGPFDIEPSPLGDRIVHTAAGTVGLELVITSIVTGQREPKTLEAGVNFPSWDETDGSIIFHLNNGAASQVMRWNRGTGRIAPLTTGPGPNMIGHVSPNGEKLLFSSERDGDREIYMKTLPDGPEIRMTNHLGRDGYARFSPSGDAMAWHSALPSGDTVIRIMQFEAGTISQYECP
jgi:Tol biopolymer transport system component